MAIQTTAKVRTIYALVKVTSDSRIVGPYYWDSIPELWDSIPRTFDNF